LQRSRAEAFAVAREIGVTLRELLRPYRSAVLDRWRDRIVATYPEDTSQFLQGDRNRFSNPVGHGIAEGTAGLFDRLVDGCSATDAAAALENLIKIRAVQDFPPSRAVAFVFLLKDVIREALSETEPSPESVPELSELDAWVDEAGLAVFDRYVGCKEQVFEVRANEMRRRTARILKYLEHVSGLQEEKMVRADDDGHVMGGNGP
jgi:hypothetical protein